MTLVLLKYYLSLLISTVVDCEAMSLLKKKLKLSFANHSSIEKKTTNSVFPTVELFPSSKIMATL